MSKASHHWDGTFSKLPGQCVISFTFLFYFGLLSPLQKQTQDKHFSWSSLFRRWYQWKLVLEWTVEIGEGKEVNTDLVTLITTVGSWSWILGVRRCYMPHGCPSQIDITHQLSLELIGGLLSQGHSFPSTTCLAWSTSGQTRFWQQMKALSKEIQVLAGGSLASQQELRWCISLLDSP